jgi:DNA-binding transcriptional MerR regulator
MGTVPEQLLPIGQFSARTRLSIKALRLYDRLGLVVPVRIDPETGYRWYSAGQVDRARLVGLLRRLDMPLARIAEVTGLPGPQTAAAVRAHVSEARRTVQERAELAGYICLLLDHSDRSNLMDKYEVQVRTVPARAVLSGTRRAHAAELGQILGTLLGRMRASGPGLAGVEGCPYTIYYAQVTEDSDGPVEMVRPMADLAQAEQAAAALGDVQARVEPAHDEAFIRMTMRQTRGGRAQLEILDALQRFVASSGRDVNAPPRQVMIADWRTAGPDEPACDLVLPLQPTETHA